MKPIADMDAVELADAIDRHVALANESGYVTDELTNDPTSIWWLFVRAAKLLREQETTIDGLQGDAMWDGR